MPKVRVRFAPSPTGFFHIGGARTALFNWLYARHTGGTFVLRIEDTDAARNTPEALRVLIDGMRWLGLNWDEGPDVGGAFGPYFQSQRTLVYKKYLEKLQATGRVYEQDGALLFKVSGQPQVIYDVVRGKVERLEEKDFVIVRSSGVPVFHFVNVVDDIDMRISHVIRGEDHLSNSSKHVELFKAFEVEPPIFAHIPLILKTDGPGKMSKRDQGALIEDYRNRHFIPQALRNYLALLGWSPKDDREILSVAELISLFDIRNVNKNNARFDDKKLFYINAEYVRELSLQSFTFLAKPILLKAGVIQDGFDQNYFNTVMALVQEKIRSLEELPAFTFHFFRDDFVIDEKAREQLSKKTNIIQRISECLEVLLPIQDFSKEVLEQSFKELAKIHNIPIAHYMASVRLILSGMDMGPSFYHMLEVLGKEKVIHRMQGAFALDQA